MPSRAAYRRACARASGDALDARRHRAVTRDVHRCASMRDAMIGA
jgi:hypothetical protein